MPSSSFSYYIVSPPFRIYYNRMTLYKVPFLGSLHSLIFFQLFVDQMYFITSSKPGIFLIGIYESRLYGFGVSKNNKLCIYSKSIFDTGDWEEFFVIDIEPVKAECCETGLHVAAGICDRTISIAARCKELTRVFSIDILTKELVKCKMLEEIYEEYKFPDVNLCCKCVMPVIQFQFYALNLRHFIITPRQNQKEVGIFRISFSINISNHCLLWDSLTPFFLETPLSPNIAVNCEGEALYVSEKAEDGRIKTFSVRQAGRQFNLSTPDDFAWHDITFFHDNLKEMYCVIREHSDGNILLNLCDLNFTDENSLISIGNFIACTVDADFPPFESSPFFLSYHLDDVKSHSSACCTGTVKPDFIVFHTADSIITVPLRMLTLRESAYLSLRKLPEPSALLVAEVKFSIFKWIKWLFNFFLRKPKQVSHPWMSLNFISKALGLSNTFHLL